MNKTKLMKLYDESYDRTLTEILHMVSDREEAKEMLGRIYKETEDKLIEVKSVKDVERVFDEFKVKYGLYKAA